MRARLLAGSLALTLAATLQAQAVDSLGTSVKKAPPRRTVITFNPFAALAEYFAGDVETKVSPTVSLGVGFSTTGIEDYNNYTALEAKVRYYPAEEALKGFSVAGTVGVATARTEAGRFQTCGSFGCSPAASERATRGTIGTELSYQWLLGPTDRFVTVIGLGVKRFLGKEGEFDPINIPILPTARINIGFAF